MALAPRWDVAHQQFPLALLSGRFGGEPARADGVDVDTAARPLQCQGRGKLVYRSLGGAGSN